MGIAATTFPAAMDSTSPLSARGRASIVLAFVASLFAAVVLLSFGPSTLPMVPALVSAQYVAMSAVCGFTALLLFGVARSSGRRGYLILAGTYLYVAGVNLASPLFLNNGLLFADPPEQLLGGLQSAVHAYSLWHWAFIIGVITGAVVLETDRVHGRRPGLRRGSPIGTALGVTAVLVVSLLAIAVLTDVLPTMFVGATLTPLTRWLSAVRLFVTLAGTGYVAVLVWRRGALINRWLLAVLLVLIVESMVVLRPERNMVTYYANLTLALVAMSVLLVVLSWTLSRVGRMQAEAAATDVSTGVRSRSSLLEELARELDRATYTREHVGLLWLDLDGFQQVNDQLGHEAGDEVLRQVAGRVEGAVRHGDVVGRLGGDEFGVVLCDLARDIDVHVADVGSRILAAIREPMPVADTTVLVTASIGVAVSATRDASASDLCLQADVSMYAAKNAGGDAVEPFSEALGERALRQAMLRHDLAAALRDGAFSLDFQPIVDARDLHWAGAEALVRWARGHDRVSAWEFIDFAERTGQIVGIGRQVVDLLGDAAPAILESGGPDFFITLNLSVKELAATPLVDRVLFGPLGTMTAHLVVEVTESFELHADAKAVENLARLRDAGIGVAIDDFGSGYSNLTELTELRPRFIKADRSLVEAATSGTKEGVALLAAAKAIADALGCDVIAEGVETALDDAIARALGLRYLQGYLHARPMPLTTLLDGLTPPSHAADVVASSETATIAFARFGRDGKLRHGSPQFLAITGAQEGAALVDLLPEGQREPMEYLLEGGVLPAERRYVQFAGVDRPPVSLLVAWERDGDDLLLVGQANEADRDAAELMLVRLNSRVAELARESAKKSAELESAITKAQRMGGGNTTSGQPTQGDHG